MGKWTKQRKRGDVVIEGKDTDIIIPVMGPTGVGKSTFINNFMSENVVLVGHDLKSCTAQLKPVYWPITEPAHLQGRRLVLIDTPGFDDTYTSDSEILRRIAVTLASSYDSKMKLGGIIYLHDISHPRMLGSDRQNLEVFKDLCGIRALSSVVIGITKSGEISKELSEKRRNELSSGYWKAMIDAGATVRELGNNTPSAQDMINNLLANAQLSVEAVDIQREIVDSLKLVPETNAGKQLKSTLKEVLEHQKKLALEAENDVETRNRYSETVKNLGVQIKALKIPFSHRLLSILGLA